MDAWIDNECTQEELKRSPGSLFTAQMIEHLGVIFLCLVFSCIEALCLATKNLSSF